MMNASLVARRSAHPGARRLLGGFSPLALLVCMALAGLAGGQFLGLHDMDGSPYYRQAVVVLLAIGLYASTSGISTDELASNFRTVLIAVTVGVLAKAIVIAAAMLLVVGNPVYALLLGVAVAQIDPLSVAAMVGNKGMSDSAKTVLRAWSSFDDPVTTLLTVYLLTVAASGGHVLPVGQSVGGPLGLLTGFGLNLLFAGVVFAGWAAMRAVNARPAVAALLRRPGPRRVHRVAGVLVLLAVGYYAVTQFALFGLAIIGLFLRPVADAVLARVTKAALLLATAALGLLLVGGVNWTAGIVLGVAAYGAQVLLAPLVARSHTLADRTYLALGQQNGITAITLALLVEPAYPGTVSIIAPAILTVNALHAACGAAWEAFHATRPDFALSDLAVRALRAELELLFGAPAVREILARQAQRNHEPTQPTIVRAMSGHLH
jgi:NhaP-type Na+/H+ or K+/H+ antiporter